MSKKIRIHDFKLLEELSIKAKNYFMKPKIAEFQLEAFEVKVGDEILITGPTTGVIQMNIESLFKDEKKVDSAVKGDEITFPVSEKVRPNDKLFLIVDVKNDKPN